MISIYFFISTDREIFEEQIAPVVLDIEEKAKDEDHVHEADEDHHHHPRVDRHPYFSLRLCHYISEELLNESWQWGPSM